MHGLLPGAPFGSPGSPARLFRPMGLRCFVVTHQTQPTETYMETLIKMADGEEVRLTSDADGIVRVIADALDRAGSTTDERNRHLPRGFVRFTMDDGKDVVLNAAQIDTIRADDKSPNRIKMVV